MTREEAIGKWIYPAIATMWNEDKCMEIIEALEQEPVIDKIRAEIEQERDKVYQNSHGHDIYYGDGLDTALEIIDKYKAESEG